MTESEGLFDTDQLKDFLTIFFASDVSFSNLSSSLGDYCLFFEFALVFIEVCAKNDRKELAREAFQKVINFWPDDYDMDKDEIFNKALPAILALKESGLKEEAEQLIPKVIKSYINLVDNYLEGTDIGFRDQHWREIFKISDGFPDLRIKLLKTSQTAIRDSIDAIRISFRPQCNSFRKEIRNIESELARVRSSKSKSSNFGRQE